MISINYFFQLYTKTLAPISVLRVRKVVIIVKENAQTKQVIWIVSRNAFHLEERVLKIVLEM